MYNIIVLVLDSYNSWITYYIYTSTKYLKFHLAIRKHHECNTCQINKMNNFGNYMHFKNKQNLEQIWGIFSRQSPWQERIHDPPSPGLLSSSGFDSFLTCSALSSATATSSPSGFTVSSELFSSAGFGLSSGF